MSSFVKGIGGKCGGKLAGSPGGDATSVAALAVAAAIVFGGCSPSKPQEPTRRGAVILDVSPPEARVYVNEKLEGTAEMFASKLLTLSWGKHRVKLIAKGYFPSYAEIVVSEKTVTLRIEMKPVPPPLD